MNTTKLILTLCLSLFSQLVLFAQKETFNDILNVQIRNIGTIETANEVTGHYIFYKTEKLDRKTFSYKLSIMNQDLVLIKDIEKTGSKFLVLLECVYNGNSIMMKYIDSDKKELEFEIYNDKGEMSYAKKIQMTDFELNAIAQQSKVESDMMSFGLHSIGTSGFIDIASTKDKDYKYEVRYFDNSDINKNWIIESPNTKGIESAGFVTANDEKIVLSVMKRAKLLSTNQDYFTTILSTKNGEILKEYENISLGNVVFFKGFFTKDNEINLIGNIYKKNDSPYKDEPEEIISYILTENNELVNKKQGAYNQFTIKNSKEKNPGQIHFHDIIQMDNKIYIIGEYFKRASGKSGAAISSLGGGVTVNDFVVAELNSDLKVEKLKVFEKKSHSVSLPSGAIYFSSTHLGLYILYYGGYDYRYTQIIKSEKPYFITTYLEKSDKKGKEPSQFKMISNIDGEFSEDAVSLKSDATDMMVSKAKPGHILITEYFKNEKKLILRLEKINI